MSAFSSLSIIITEIYVLTRISVNKVVLARAPVFLNIILLAGLIESNEIYNAFTLFY
jgi:hypothetical protein